MPDVSNLPEICATWINDQAFFIKRGIMGMKEAPIATRNDVERYNLAHNVTPAQRVAMENGCVLGWDSAGAVPAGSSEKLFQYTANLTMLLRVSAYNEEQAAAKVETEVTKFLDDAWEVHYQNDQILSLSFSSDDIDFIE